MEQLTDLKAKLHFERANIITPVQHVHCRTGSLEKPCHFNFTTATAGSLVTPASCRGG